VGIDDYRDQPQNGYPNQKLKGCVHDAVDLGLFLCENRAFDKNKVRAIINPDDATEENLRILLAWLADGAQPGDRLLFHFSGHGTQVTRNGLLQDAICAHDFNPITGCGVLTRADFFRLFGGIPAGVEFICTLDSCYSGGLLWGRDNEVTRRVRSFPLPPEVASKIEAARGRHVMRIALAETAAPLKRVLIAQALGDDVPVPADADVSLNGVSVSACAANELAHEIDNGIRGHPNGEFTCRLLQQLAAPSGLNDTLAMIVTKVARGLNDQNPQLSGSEDIKDRPWMEMP
jgi:hypothetical protein